MQKRSWSKRPSMGREAKQPLTQAQEDNLLFMLEEEKLAGDLYQVFADQTGFSVFSQISASEDRHYAALLRYAETAGLPVDAITGLPAGEYVNPEIQALYDTLLEQGNTSDVAALEVGALVEHTDIIDLQSALVRMTDTRLADVYSRLLDSSINHLNAFNHQMELMR